MLVKIRVCNNNKYKHSRKSWMMMSICFFFFSIVFIELLTGTVVERRVELFYSGRGGKSRRGAGRARDEGPRGDQDNRSLQVVLQV